MMEGHNMTPEQPRTATIEEINQAAVRVGVRQHRLEWVVRFAKEELDTLSPGQMLDRRLELKAFFMYSQGIGGNPEAMKLPTDETMQAIQQSFADIIARVLQGEPVHLGQYTMTTSLIWMPLWGRHHRGTKRTPRFVQMPERTILTEQELEVYQAKNGLARLIDELYREGRIIRVCEAPKPRAKAEERCGRWFVGRPNQTFCSPACRNLANTRATRAKQRPPRRRRT
jgi:hypothetical protein